MALGAAIGRVAARQLRAQSRIAGGVARQFGGGGGSMVSIAGYSYHNFSDGAPFGDAYPWPPGGEYPFQRLRVASALGIYGDVPAGFPTPPDWGPDTIAPVTVGFEWDLSKGDDVTASWGLPAGMWRVSLSMEGYQSSVHADDPRIWDLTARFYVNGQVRQEVTSHRNDNGDSGYGRAARITFFQLDLESGDRLMIRYIPVWFIDTGYAPYEVQLQADLVRLS